jgi:mRNA-degrading endonuclease RelE of RelBE toxin-antitoxin system
MSDALRGFLLVSQPFVSFDAARRRLPALAKQVRDRHRRVLLGSQGSPSDCLVPLEDAMMLMQLEHRIDSETGQRALEAWERNGKRISPVESLLKRFGFRPRTSNWPVAIADTAEADLASLSEDHRSLARAISQLGKHFAVMTARRLGHYGELRGARIDGYRAIFMVEHEHVVLLRFGAGLAPNLLS